MIRKAVILARGLGTRMQREAEGVQLDETTRAWANRGMKAMIPVAGRPFVDYVVENCIRAGFTQICFVVAPDNNVLREHYAAHTESLNPVTIHFANQLEPKGTADAVYAAKEFVGEESFVMLNCDNLYPVSDLIALREVEEGANALPGYDREQLIAKSNIPPDRIARFAVVDVDAQWNLKRIVEKPDNPEDYAVNGKVLVSMNIFRFTPDIFTACERIEPHPVRGEYELPSAVQYLIDHRLAPFKVIPSQEGVLDLTGKADIASVRQLLEGMKIAW
ncbi:MAG: nucleotidyltransferase family protein [Abditibacteriales bacterium]|nr:nucleotidyltransferase family protein [Abditibacteriales bacterium]MDW8364735.1 nucleotidyltransferase family protein [Abditibacteriales bacterium]